MQRDIDLAQNVSNRRCICDRGQMKYASFSAVHGGGKRRAAGRYRQGGTAAWERGQTATKRRLVAVPDSRNPQIGGKLGIWGVDFVPDPRKAPRRARPLVFRFDRSWGRDRPGATTARLKGFQRRSGDVCRKTHSSPILADASEGRYAALRLDASLWTSGGKEVRKPIADWKFGGDGTGVYGDAGARLAHSIRRLYRCKNQRHSSEACP